MDIIARGDNKISVHLRGGMQVDVRLLPPDSFGAAMQYFTGSKAHNVALRQRALKMGPAPSASRGLPPPTTRG